VTPSTAIMLRRTETRLYHSASLTELDKMEKELAPLGFVLVEQFQCPDGCRCGCGPYWSHFRMPIPTDPKGMN